MLLCTKAVRLQQSCFTCCIGIIAAEPDVHRQLLRSLLGLLLLLNLCGVQRRLLRLLQLFDPSSSVNTPVQPKMVSLAAKQALACAGGATVQTAATSTAGLCRCLAARTSACLS